MISTNLWPKSYELWETFRLAKTNNNYRLVCLYDLEIHLRISFVFLQANSIQKSTFYFNEQIGILNEIQL